METKEHRLMKEVVIGELRKLGYSDISTEEIIKNAYPRQFLSSLWFKELSRDSELSRVRKILGEPDKYGSKSSKPKINAFISSRFPPSSRILFKLKPFVVIKSPVLLL